MKLSKIMDSPAESLIRMERYVNKGSPSGYTFVQTTSNRYAPLTGTVDFLLPYYFFKRDEVLIYGDRNINLGPLSEAAGLVPFPIHPDMIDIFVSKFHLKEFSRASVKNYLKVIPMANGRTVLTSGRMCPFYIKLHYEGVLGRVQRGMPRIKAIAGIEVSREVEDCVDKGFTPSCFALLREPQARVKYCSSKELPEIGVTFRETVPYPKCEGRFVIPFFALFSYDRDNPNDPFLLTQILGLTGNPVDTLFSMIIEPILKCYTFLVFQRGLIPEINAQNILLEIDQNGTPVRIVHRDLQGYHKDLAMRRSKGLSPHFDSYPYRCIDETSESYYKRHSYCYDFRLCCHIFDELLDVAEKDFKQQRSILEKRIATIFHELSDGQELTHFRPVNKWFAYDKTETLLTSKTNYKELDNPKYRRTE